MACTTSLFPGLKSELCLQQKLGACPDAVQTLLGAERCSWGPAFWCKNMQTASMCNVSSTALWHSKVFLLSVRMIL